MAGHPGEPSHPVDLVVIGHVGSATDLTPSGTGTYTGGSGFAVAFAASKLLGSSVGLVTQLGEDFQLADLRLLSIDMQGVAIRPGESARFIHQLSDGALEFLRDQGCRAQISVDMFEPFVAAEPDTCRQVCFRADLIFLNEAEYDGLYRGRVQPPVPTLIKHGPAGAEFVTDGARHHATAPPVDEVDSIGAGEILVGVFLALRALGLAEDGALRYAVGVATRSVTEFGVVGPAVTRELSRVRAELTEGRNPDPPG